MKVNKVVMKMHDIKYYILKYKACKITAKICILNIQEKKCKEHVI